MANLWKVLPSSAPAGGSPVWTGKTTASIAADAMFARSLVASFSVKEASVDSASIISHAIGSLHVSVIEQSSDTTNAQVKTIVSGGMNSTEPLDNAEFSMYSIVSGGLSIAENFFDIANFEADQALPEIGAVVNVQETFNDSVGSSAKALVSAAMNTEEPFSDTLLVLPKLGRRTPTARLRKHVQSEIEPSVKVFLITIYHDDLSEPIRVCSDKVERLGSDEYNVYYGVVSNGRTFYYAGFEACLVNDEDGAAPQVQISIPNADRSMTEAIEQMGPGPIKVDIEIVFADTPDIIEVALTAMEMADITYDETTITGTVSRDLLFTEPYRSKSFTPKHFPFLFSTRTTT